MYLGRLEMWDHPVVFVFRADRRGYPYYILFAPPSYANDRTLFGTFPVLFRVPKADFLFTVVANSIESETKT